MKRRAGDSDPRAPGDSEERFVAWIEALTDSGLGDDAAVLRLDGSFAWTVDAQHEGVHLPIGCDPAIAARRLLAVNLSDLAAMGAEPRFCLLSLAAPPAYDRRRFVRALVTAASRAGVRLIGGDTSRLDTVSATLALVGRKPAGARWLRRRDARAGDALYVGGTLGEAALGLALQRAGASWQRGRPTIPAELRGDRALERAARRALLRHMLPSPQLELSRMLARSRRRVAALDVSDGLGKDLARLCRASGVGAEIDVLPLAPGAGALAARLGHDARELALYGGEDYVLLFTLPPGVSVPPGCVRIGRAVAEPGTWLCDEDGRRRPIEAAGFDHLSADGKGSRSARRSIGA
jgi:thiamine-monophosphate kinase